MKQLNLFVKKEFLHVFRDKKTLLMLFGLPIMQIILFGFALSNEIKNSRIVVCDFAKDEASKAIIEKMRASSHFEIEASLLTYDEIELAFKKGKIKSAIVFPNKFYSDLLQQNLAHISLIFDATDPNTANVLSFYANSIIMEYQRERVQLQEIPYQIIPELRMLYNPEMKSAANFVPGVMAFILLLVCVLMSATSIVKEKETGSMEILLVSPFNPYLLVISKAIPYLLISLINITIILLLSVFVLELPIKGSVFLFYALSCLFIFTALLLGLLISNSTDSQQSAMLISLLGMLIPSLLLTGFVFPIENMPLVFQYISNLIPSKWYYIIIKNIMLKGLGFSAIWKETAILLGMMFFLLIITIKNFKIRLE